MDNKMNEGNLIMATENETLTSGANEIVLYAAEGVA